MDISNMISGSSAFSKTSLNIWKFMVHRLLKPGLENFEHYFASVWDECNCVVVWVFFGIAFLWDWNELTFSSPVSIAEFSHFAGIGECWIYQKMLPHIQRQRRKPRKMLGVAKPRLESNPIPAVDNRRPQTNLVRTRTQRPHWDWARTVSGCLLWRYRSAVACRRGQGSGSSRPGCGISPLRGGRREAPTELPELTQAWGNRLLEGTKRTLWAPGPRRKGQWPQKRLLDFPWVSRSLRQRHEPVVACCRVGGTECSSGCMGPSEGGHHYLHCLHHSLDSGQKTGREHSPAHQQKIELRFADIQKRCPFHCKGLECKSSKSGNTWRNR